MTVIDDQLHTITLLVLLALAAHQTWQYARVLPRSLGRPPRTGLLVAAAWVLYGTVNVATVTRASSYADAVGAVLLGLYVPALLAVVALAVSPAARARADRLPLRWLVATVQGWPRMVVGVVFLLWWAAGLLPAVVAWVAGPGDWIAGWAARREVRRLTPLARDAGIEHDDWTVAQLRRAPPGATSGAVRAHRTAVVVVLGVVAFGVADFVAAPASTAVAIALGDVPEAMGALPLALVPLLLVPQVLLLDVLAIHQLLELRRLADDTRDAAQDVVAAAATQRGSRSVRVGS